ncbi:MAG: DUF4097 domain-containing protein [Oscillospiraceae bacterium]|nr:DUF4097 domain-containing protein [Oscillospiraceae bacterium]
MKKTLTSIAVIALAAGTVMIAAAWGLGARGAVSFGPSGLRVTRQGKEETLSQRGIEGVTSLDIAAVSADIEFIPAENFGFDIRTSAGEPKWSLENGKLSIEETHTAWAFHLEFPLFAPAASDSGGSYVKVYYPMGESLDRLAVSAVSGDMDFPGLSGRVSESSFSTVSGNISVAALDTDALSFASVSGNIEARDISARHTRLGSTSGSAALAGFFGEFEANTVSGDIAIAAQSDGTGSDYKIETVSGTINVAGRRVDGISAQSSAPGAGSSFYVKTVSGDITIDW